MNAPNRIATIALVARIIMVLTTLLFIAAIVALIYQASTGDLSGVQELMEREINHPLTPWQIALGAVLLTVAVAPLLMAFWSAHRFFRHFTRAEIFAGGMERTVRSLGWSLVLYWLMDWLTDLAAIPLVTATDPSGVQVEFGISIDETIALPIVGIILILIARALAEARRIDEDSKLIV